MKRILFVCSGYEKILSPNAICIDKLIKCFVRRGFDITCLSAVFNKELPKTDRSRGYKVYRLNYSVISRCFRKLRSWNRFVGTPLRGVFRFILMAISLMIVLICPSLVFILFWPYLDLVLSYRMYRKICLLDRQCNFDAIVAIHDPHEALAATYCFVKKRENICCFNYYLDALSAGTLMHIKNSNKNLNILKSYYFFCTKLLEIIYAKNAKKIIVTDATRTHYERNFKETDLIKKLEYLGIPVVTETFHNFNGNNELPIELSSEKTSIVFTGSLTYLRDPTLILNVAEKLVEDENIEWIFVGDIYPLYRNRIVELQTLYPGYFKIYKRISYDAVDAVINQADICLNIDDNVPTLYASKILEYISHQRPIISTSSPNNIPTNQLLQKYPLALTLYNTDSVDVSVERVRRFISDCKGKKISFAEIKKNFYYNTPDAFVDIIERALAQNCKGFMCH